MSTNVSYFDNRSIEKTAHELTNVHSLCVNHGGSKDSYASPAFSEWKKTALTLDDIPMQTCDIDKDHPIREQQHQVPWEDSIKNFIFDSGSLSTSSRFITCILLSEIGYKYQEATIHMIAGKYGKENVTLIDVMPHEHDTTTYPDEFKLRVRSKDIDFKYILESSTLTSTLVQWYEPNDTIIFCHDNSIIEYQDTISMMTDSTWSISCTYTNYIKSNSTGKCKYVCPNFACPGSLETRAIGSGTAIFTDKNAPAEYIGRLNYYSRCVRSSKHYSGKCYDCKKLETTVNYIYKSPLSSPITPRFVNFDLSFTNLTKRGSNLYSDSGYGSIHPGNQSTT